MAQNLLRLRRSLSSSSLVANLHRSLLATSALSSVPRSSSPSPSSSSAVVQSLQFRFQSRSFRSSSFSSARPPYGSNNQNDEIGPDTILFEGCDYNHWLIVMDFPRDNKPSREEMVRTYEETCARGLNIRKRSHHVPSVSLLQFHQALLDMLRCPPHDSLIRDHAVSLAVFVQNQLSGPNFESSNGTMDQAALADKDLELVNEGPVSEEVLSHHENSCADEHVAVGTETSSTVACGNGLYNEGCGEEITSSEMGRWMLTHHPSVLSGSRQRALI